MTSFAYMTDGELERFAYMHCDTDIVRELVFRWKEGQRTRTDAGTVALRDGASKRAAENLTHMRWKEM